LRGGGLRPASAGNAKVSKFFTAASWSLFSRGTPVSMVGHGVPHVTPGQCLIIRKRDVSKNFTPGGMSFRGEKYGKVLYLWMFVLA